uniref:Uncharacterized protein n=1 Tax=Daphnia galeata TaxID=27404 RepID=A0A8J2RLN0_9CRUS|nr:unnamed protein product [Daphnia galeata]
MADEDAEAIIQGAKAIKDCEEQINFILAEVEKIRHSLRNLREDVKGFQKKCNVAKTVGTTSGVAGAGLAIVGCVGAFFTGGVSLLLTAGSLAATGTGVAVNVTTNVIDRKETKKCIENINHLVSDLQHRFKKLECILAQHATAVKWFMDSHGLNENEAIYFLTKFAQENFAKISNTLIVLGKGTAAFKAAGELSRTIKTMKSIATLTKASAGGMSFSITKPLQQLTEIEEKAIRNYAQIAMGHTSVLSKIFQGGIIALNVGFIVWDIVSLVQGWTNNHPAVEVIDDVLLRKSQLFCCWSNALTINVSDRVYDVERVKTVESRRKNHFLLSNCETKSHSLQSEFVGHVVWHFTEIRENLILRLI